MRRRDLLGAVGTDVANTAREAARQVGRLLNGARPAELPFVPRSQVSVVRRGAALAGIVFLLCGAPAIAQIASRTYRLAILSPSPTPGRSIVVDELAKRGFVEGKNLIIEDRVGTPEQLVGLARELIATRPDAIITISAAGAAAKSATNTVPIITFGPDPMAQGFVESLARPGGNVTGVVILAAELDGKRLQLLNEAVPRRRVAVLLHPATRSLRQSRQEITATAGSIGVEALFFDANGPDDYALAFAAMRAAEAESLLITANPWFFRDRELLARLAREAGLATICEWGEMAASGCLIGYGPRRAELYTRVADLVARVLRGTPPGDLPVEQPASFELVVNLRTAKALGLGISPALLLRADEVIE